MTFTFLFVLQNYKKNYMCGKPVIKNMTYMRMMTF